MYTLNTIIKNRKSQGRSTFVAFVDMEKAFDRIDRALLFHKLLTLGIGGKIFNCIKNMYDSCEAIISLNNYSTPTFPTNNGIKQGDSLSPTLFGLFINDIVSVIKESASGTRIEDTYIHCLLYADDIALIAESEEDLQRMLDAVYRWCMKWRMRENPSLGKTHVIHFRPPHSPRTKFKFK